MNLSLLKINSIEDIQELLRNPGLSHETRRMLGNMLMYSIKGIGKSSDGGGGNSNYSGNNSLDFSSADNSQYLPIL